MSISIQSCQNCRAQHFPPRVLCPACESNTFTWSTQDFGVIEEMTTLNDGTAISTIVVEGGPKLVARVDATSAVGDRVRLSDRPDIGAHEAFIPAVE